MHEWAMVKEAVDEITRLGNEKQMKKVNKVCLALGEDEHLTPESLRLCFQALSKGTIVETAELEVKSTEGHGLIIMHIEGEEDAP